MRDSSRACAAAIACAASIGVGAGPARALEVSADVATLSSATSLLGTVVLVSPLLELGATLTPDLAFQLQWGFTVASGSAPAAGLSGARFMPGNPTLSFPWRVGEGLVLAPGIALPAAELPARDAPAFPIARAATNGARAARGTLDQWLWFAGEAALVVPLHAAKWVAPFLLEAEATFAYLAPVTRLDPDDDFVFQGVARAAWRATDDLWVGLAFGGVWVPTNHGDNAQTSIAPEVRWTFGGRGHVEARLVMNLDTPFGPAFEAGRIAAFHLGGAIQL